ncbi:hypothetical protein PR048_026758 [Dryococelus australis]|uniref:Uncharacterized protein n=1 Tax=Dryococelus australis TaxID=614101 RepID=A0ABQ9GM85_9NEOP|nr:hypothetical protein PR048_026758 [Dryococelus australis]
MHHQFLLKTLNVFGVIHRLHFFCIFNLMMGNYEKKHTKTNLTRTSQTRWSAKSEALTEGQYQPEIKLEVGSLLRALLDFWFISYLVALAELLKEIDRVNKEVQKGDIILSRSIGILKGLTNTIERLRNTPSEWLKTVKVMAESIGVEPTMGKHRVAKKENDAQ